ncbi:MAG: hypothetical protein MJ093_06190 [Saccharofermentans sp.]|nr:hypothetical protein [Saccharofermentans sp.]
MNLRKVPSQDFVEEQHGPVFNFFTSLGTYFLQIMSANALFFIFNLPMMFVAFMASVYFLPQLNPVMVPENFAKAMESVGLIGNDLNNAVGADAAYQLYYIIVLILAMFLLGTLLFCIGPFQAGFSQIYRNIYRKEGVFFFHDFKEGLISNVKQSVIAMIISIVITFAIVLSIVFYGRMDSDIGNAIMVMFVFVFAVFILIQNMVYNMMVSVDLPLKDLYKNAFLFFLIKFVPCVGLLLVQLLMLVVIPILLFSSTAFFGYAMAILLYISFSFAFCHYMMAYFTGEMINTYIVPKLSPVVDEESDEKVDDEDEDESDDEDDETEEDSSGEDIDD